MLKNMRENLKSYHWILWIVIGSFVISIFFWDTGVSWTGGMGTSWAATVNGEEIPADEFQRAFRNQVEFLRRAFGDRWDPMYVEQVGVADQVVDTLVQQRVALQEARRLGLQATPREIMKAVRKNQVFLDDQGRFVGLRKYEEILRRNNLDVNEFEQELDDQVTYQKFQDLVRASVLVRPDEVEEALRRDRDQVIIEYALFDPSQMEPVADPGEEVLRSWYQDHIERFQEEEVRQVRYLHLTQERALGAVAEEEAIRNYYNENPDRFTVPSGSRRASQILVRVAPNATEEEREEAARRAEALAARAKAGEDFALLARENSDDLGQARDGGDLGYFAQDELMPSINDAVFAMDEGEVRGPIQSPLGLHILKLTEIVGEDKVRPLEDARREVGAILYFSQMQDWLAQQSELIAEAAANGRSLGELAEQFQLEIHDAAVPKGEGIRSLGSFPEIEETIASTEPGQLSAPLTVVDGEIVFLEVTGVDAAVAKPFDTVRTEVLADWRETQASAAARAAAESALEAAGDGSTLEEGLADTGVELQESSAFTRGGFMGDLGTQPVLAKHAFSLDEGELGPVVSTDSGFVIFRVKEHNRLTAEEIEEQRPTYRRYLENLRFQQIWEQALTRLKDESSVKVNDGYVKAVKQDYIQRSRPAGETAAGG